MVLALKVLCGFSTGEIARAFLTSESAIEKQLTRTKQRIHNAGIGFEIPEGEDLTLRLDPRMAEIPGPMPFDCGRMIYGGFTVIVDAAAK